MKKVIFAGLALLAIIACSKEEEENTIQPNAGINGSWKLTSVLSDPGDGSGTFTAVNSNKKLTFTASGKVTSNGNICVMDDASGKPTSGTYSIVDSTITSGDCDSNAVPLFFKVKNQFLDVYYPCIEPCIARYSQEN